MIYGKDDIKDLYKLEEKETWKAIRRSYYKVEERLTNFSYQDNLGGGCKGWTCANIYSSQAERFEAVYGIKTLEEPFEAIDVIKGIFPDVINIGFSKLAPNTLIPKHREQMHTLRIQLCLITPSTDMEQVGFAAKRSMTNYEKGKAFGFHETDMHHVWNNTLRERVVCLIDLPREDMKEVDYECDYL